MRAQLMDQLVDNAMEQINGSLKLLLPGPEEKDATEPEAPADV